MKVLAICAPQTYFLPTCRPKDRQVRFEFAILEKWGWSKTAWTVWKKIFHLAERDSSVRVEVMAGLTTFLAMAYIICGESVDSCRHWNGFRGRFRRNLYRCCHRVQF